MHAGDRGRRRALVEPGSHARRRSPHWPDMRGLHPRRSSGQDGRRASHACMIGRKTSCWPRPGRESGIRQQRPGSGQVVARGAAEGQAAQLRDVMDVVRAVPDGRGLGVFYWDATWTAVPGNGWTSRDPAQGNAWENQALFDFRGRALPAMRELRR